MSNKLVSCNRRVGALWCTDVLVLLNDYLDGELTPQDRAAVEAHVAGCDNCRRFGGDLGALVAAIGRVPAGELQPEVTGRLLARLARGVDW